MSTTRLAESVEGLNSSLALVQCFSKWVESPPCGRFWWARGRKNQRGR